MKGTFEKITHDEYGIARIHISIQAASSSYSHASTPQIKTIRTRFVVGADGAKSEVARQCIKDAERTKYVFAYHEIVRAPTHQAGYDSDRCDVYYRGSLSPDFYGWVFPHGDTMSIGTGSADKGFSLRGAVARLRETAGLQTAETLRREGAPIPLKPLPHWDNGKDVILAGDAAGVVAPASGEGIYYAMACGRMAADAVDEALKTDNPACLKKARKNFMRQHGKVFWVLGIMQYFWYQNDKRREKFVKICEDKDVQQLTFESYMNKVLSKRKPMAHLRIFFKDLAHLLGMVKA
jgi:geranylgeranyl reductase